VYVDLPIGPWPCELTSVGWNTKISARDTNYGTRIDYFLVTPGLLPWIKHSDIQPSIKGSDHCPVFVDLYDEITLPSGEPRALRDVLSMSEGRRDPPRLASKFWVEFQGRQTLMSSFFVKAGATKANMAKDSTSTVVTVAMSSASLPVTPATPASTATRVPFDSEITSPGPNSLLASAFDALGTQKAPDAPSTSQSTQSPSSPYTPSLPSTSQALSSLPSSPSPQTSENYPKKLTPLKPSQQPQQPSRKRPQADTSAATPKAKRAKPGQAKLSSFFVKPSQPAQPPSSSQSSSSQVTEIDDNIPVLTSTPQATLEADLELARLLSEQMEAQGEAVAPVESESREAWSTLFAPVPPPKCAVHNEPAKEHRVNKPGPNKGKVFYVCSRCACSVRVCAVGWLTAAGAAPLAPGTIRVAASACARRSTIGISATSSSGRATSSVSLYAQASRRRDVPVGRRPMPSIHVPFILHLPSVTLHLRTVPYLRTAVALLSHHFCTSESH
jgi:AP endonuclease-2